MNDYTKELGFWQRLESFVTDVQTNCCMGEEEKDMILYNCKLKILDLQHVSKRLYKCDYCENDIPEGQGIHICRECSL
jgi:hypothetical protein